MAQSYADLLPSVGSTIGKVGLKPGSILSKGLGAAIPGLNIATGIMDAAGPIMQLFRKSPQGQDREKATGMQQNIETTALQIQDAVNKGTMRPEAAMIALDQLLKQAGGMGGEGGQTGDRSNFAAGGNTAGTIIAQIKGNVQSGMMNRNESYVNSPWKEQSDDGSTDPNAAMRTLNLPGATESMKKERLRSGLMNYMTGADSSLGNSTFGNALKPTSPYDFLGGAQDALAKKKSQEGMF